MPYYLLSHLQFALPLLPIVLQILSLKRCSEALIAIVCEILAVNSSIMGPSDIHPSPRAIRPEGMGLVICLMCTLEMQQYSNISCTISF